MASEIHVLLVAFASQGHLNPMVRLGKLLASKGLQVTIATTETARQRMLKFTNISCSSSSITNTITVNSTTEIRLEFFSDGLSLQYDRMSNLDNYFDSLGKFGPQNLSSLIENFSQGGKRKFSCIINNPFVPWVADVAEQLGIPCALLWIQPCSLYAIYYRFYNHLNAFLASQDNHVHVQLPGLPLLQYEDLPSFVLPSNTFGSIPKLFSEMFKSMEKLKWVLGNSFYELEKDAVESMAEICPIIPMGPLVPPILLGDMESIDDGVDMWKPDETCIAWLDKKQKSSVIYVSAGSIVVLSARQMEQLALGLKKSNKSFLWVVKPPEFAAKDGAGELPAGFLDDLGDQGLVVQWCPQTEVLIHPAISCFISHCGWNSTLEAVASGVPMICFPQWTDQPTNAKLITDVFRTGVRFRGDQDGLVSKEEVQICIGEVIDGPKAGEFKQRCWELKEETRKTVAHGGSSDAFTQRFVDELIALH
ncbi:indole-3-acetate beta-glucosyltransferase [Ranunculus cassubicifolius]